MGCGCGGGNAGQGGCGGQKQPVEQPVNTPVVQQQAPQSRTSADEQEAELDSVETEQAK
ncbi:hypothetical protein [Pseudomonas sp. XK-1]|jgi:peptidyl-prolyl cis-trans isomerase C|uniref:hypothetical protein n=1 Tax=Pseudomonas sp. XK-1 TaxID=3136019 RepID=UPI00311A4E0A